MNTRGCTFGLCLCLYLLLSGTAHAAADATVPSAASRVTDGIETVGFYSKVGVGYGGMLTFSPTPIVLFKSGEALRDMRGLKFAGGLAAHKAAHPKDWTTWRRAGRAIEVMGEKGWQKTAYASTMDRLPKGFTLNKTYRSVGGTGNLALGGTSAVLVWSNLSFERNGTFSSGGGSGATSESSGGGTKSSVVTSSRRAPQQGRYEIDGYTLTLRYADGRSERRMIVTDRANPSVIWLDGDGYTSK